MRGLDNIIDLTAEPNFWINDIGLFVPPTSISIHKEGLDYSIKSLRTKVSTKILSGNGIYHVQINLTFPPDSLLQLHRLISQIRNNPFVFVENEFITSSMHDREEFYYFTVMGLNLINHPSAVGTFNVELDLRLFNYKVYDPNLRYINDWGYEILVGGKKKRVTFSATEDLEKEGTESVVLSTAQEEIGSLSIRDVENLFQDNIKTFTSYIVKKPKDSKVYKRYCNYLQNIYLQENFGINLIDFFKQKPGLKNAFDRGDSGFHEVLVSNVSDAFSIELLTFREYVIGEIFKKSTKTSFIFRNFATLNLVPNVAKKLKKIVDAGITSDMTNAQKEEKRKLNFEEFVKKEKKIDLEQLPSHEEIFAKVDLSKRDIRNIRNDNQDYLSDRRFYPLIDSPKYEKVTKYRGENVLKITNTRNLGVNDYSVIPVFAFDDGEISLFEPGEVIIKNNHTVTGKYINISTGMFRNIYKEGTKVKKGDLLGYLESGKELIFFTNDPELHDYYLNDKIIKERKEKANIKNFDEINKYIQDNYSIYTGVSGLENILESVISKDILDYSFEDLELILGNSFNISTDQNFLTEDARDPNAIITAVSGSLKNLVTSIPILGEEYPTHQYLGSIEPSYQINIIGKKIIGNAVPDMINFLEQGRANSQFYAKNFSMIPDAGNFIVESLVTKLLGSYKVNNIRYIENKQSGEALSIIQHNFIINSCDTYTIEGSPLATGFNFRFSESKPYREENLRPVASSSLSSDYKRRVLDILEQTEILNIQNPIIPQSITDPIQNTNPANWSMLNWKTKYFNSHQWYSRGLPKEYKDGTLITYMNNQNAENDMNQDYNSYLLAGILDQIQDILNYYISPYDNKNGFKLTFSSTFDSASKGNRTTISNHFHGCAVDTRVEGMNVMEYAAFIELLLEAKILINPKLNKNGIGSLGLGIYGTDGNNTSVKMSVPKDRRNGFVHIDLNAVLDSTDTSGIRNINGNYYFHGFKYSRRRWAGENGDDKFGISNLSVKNNSNLFWNTTILNIKSFIFNNVTSAILKNQQINLQ
jgi:hypothetical protein